jgi:hypothetical protein
MVFGTANGLGRLRGVRLDTAGGPSAFCAKRALGADPFSEGVCGEASDLISMGLSLLLRGEEAEPGYSQVMARLGC